MSENYAIILAGGSGTRLWPLSRSLKPKQFLKLNGSESLLQNTVQRLLPKIDADHIFTVTPVDYRFETFGQLHSLNPKLTDHLLVEPCARGTLPALLWATQEIIKINPNATVSIFSADHAIGDLDEFIKNWSIALEVTSNHNLVLWGIKPDRVATEYGYIHVGPKLKGLQQVHDVLGFKEKPSAEVAEQYLKQGECVWNAGIFVYKAAQLMAWIQEHLPNEFKVLKAWEQSGQSVQDKNIYCQFKDESIDVGLVEKLDRLLVVLCDMAWSDLGSFNSLYRHLGPKDDRGNVRHGQVKDLDSEGCFLWSDDKLLATYGLKDVSVVSCRDVTLVCDRNRSEDLKSLLATFEKGHSKVLKEGATMWRPWGHYVVLEQNEQSRVKRLIVSQGQRLSLQSHEHRNEHLLVVHGKAKIQIDDVETECNPMDSVFVTKGQKHRITNIGSDTLEIIEVATGSYLEEDDIERFEDMYGRV